MYLLFFLTILQQVLSKTCMIEHCKGGGFHSVAMSRDRTEHCGPLAPRVAGGGGGRIHAKEIREAQMNGNCNAMFSLLQGQRGRVGGV